MRNDLIVDGGQTPKIDFASDRIAPITVIADGFINYTDPHWLHDLVNHWARIDDVFHPEFLQNVIIVTSQEHRALADDIRVAFHHHGVSRRLLL